MLMAFTQASMATLEGEDATFAWKANFVQQKDINKAGKCKSCATCCDGKKRVKRSAKMSSSFNTSVNFSLATTPRRRSTKKMTNDDKSGGIPEIGKICIVEPCEDRTVSHARKFGLSLIFADDVSEFLGPPADLADVAFVLQEFSGNVFEALNDARATIYGPTAIAELSSSDDESPPILHRSPRRPLFCISMRGLRIFFNGYRKKTQKEDLKRFFFMINCMGGRVVNDLTKATHLVSRNCQGDDYIHASSTIDILVVQEGWITEAWERRREVGFSAEEAEFQKGWRVRPFHGAHMLFLGFKEEEKERMLDELVSNGGKECQSYREKICTHVVIDNNNSSVQQQTMPSDIPREIHVVKEEWFWTSIQTDACADEKLYLFSDYISPRTSLPSSSEANRIFCPTFSQERSKKRRTEVLGQRNDSAGVLPSPKKKSRSSLDDQEATSAVLFNSFSPAMIDAPDKQRTDDETATMTATPTKEDSVMGSQPQLMQENASPKTTSDVCGVNPRSARLQVFTELVQTEKNYVRILDTIVRVFKEPLEGPHLWMLGQTEREVVFGDVPRIREVHAKMCEGLSRKLEEWKEPCLIGRIISEDAAELSWAYSRFINSFEDAQKTLKECERMKPEFRAFLEASQSKDECGRQTLSELLIRPVQRLGSISLLLGDLLKHTSREEGHPDGPELKLALRKIKEVLTNINDGKQKAEICREIEYRPLHLISSHSIFTIKIDVVELGANDGIICGKGSNLTLFLFPDVLEICKRRRRHKGVSRLSLGGPPGPISRNPSMVSLRDSGLFNVGMMQHYETFRPHRHVSLLDFKDMISVVDILGFPDIFALKYKSEQEEQERRFVFQIFDDHASKEDFLRHLSTNLANVTDQKDPKRSCLRQMMFRELGLDISDLIVDKKKNSFRRVTKAVSTLFSPHSSDGQHSPSRRKSMTFGRRQSMAPPSSPSLLPTTRLKAAASAVILSSSGSIDSSKSEDSDRFAVPKTPQSKTRRASSRLSLNFLYRKH